MDQIEKYRIFWNLRFYSLLFLAITAIIAIGNAQQWKYFLIPGGIFAALAIVSNHLIPDKPEKPTEEKKVEEEKEVNQEVKENEIQENEKDIERR